MSINQNRPPISIGSPEQLAAKTIDIGTRTTGLGAAGASTYNIISGLNMVGGLPNLPANTDHQGFTFFTKPQLNLTYENVIRFRRMSAYANQDPVGMANAIRCLLMPDGFVPPTAKRNGYGIGVHKGDQDFDLDGDVRSVIVDDDLPFITPLSNCLLTFNGLPDFAPETYTSNEGLAKEQVSWIDDRPYQYGVFDTTINFANMEGDVITNLYHCWLEYATRVAEGTMMPFPHNVITNRVDYQTKIYRLVMDRSKKYVQNIAATIAYPKAVPLGSMFNFNSADRLNNEAHEVSIPFTCIGVSYNDPILIKEFNKLVGRFNYRMQDSTVPNEPLDANRLRYMVKLRDMEKSLINYKAYPYISRTNELEWWVTKEVYQMIANILQTSTSI